MVNNKQFNTAAPQGGNKVNNTGIKGFFKSKTGKGVIAALTTILLVGGAYLGVKKYRARKAAAAAQPEPQQ